jgi:hypothetical protein
VIPTSLFDKLLAAEETTYRGLDGWLNAVRWVKAQVVLVDPVGAELFRVRLADCDFKPDGSVVFPTEDVHGTLSKVRFELGDGTSHVVNVRDLGR